MVGVSTDTEFVHLAWKNTPRTEGGLGTIDYPLVADTTKQISEAFDVLHPEEKVAYRGLFLIDTNGTIRHMVVNVMPLGRSVDEALRMVSSTRPTARQLDPTTRPDGVQGVLRVRQRVSRDGVSFSPSSSPFCCPPRPMASSVRQCFRRIQTERCRVTLSGRTRSMNASMASQPSRSV